MKKMSIITLVLLGVVVSAGESYGQSGLIFFHPADTEQSYFTYSFYPAAISRTNLRYIPLYQPPYLKIGGTKDIPHVPPLPRPFWHPRFTLLH